MTKKLNIMVIPDCQVKPGVDTSYLDWVGKAIVKYKPDVIVNIGDFADMPSLSTHDKEGSKSMEGKRYKEDIESVKEGMVKLLKPMKELQSQQKKNKHKVYRPRMVLTLGNHENRISRAVSAQPKFEGFMSVKDLGYEKDWEVHDFLKPVFINGVGFSHYFPTGAMGRPASSAQAMLNKMHMSCVAGHQQGKQIAYGKRADGSSITSIIAGSCYLHDEDYMDPLSNKHWRGILMLHEVVDGTFDEMFLSMNYLEKEFK
jgi:hypothetical protein